MRRAVTTMKYVALLFVTLFIARSPRRSRRRPTHTDRRARAEDHPATKTASSCKPADGSSKLLIGGISQFDGRFFVGDDADRTLDQFAFRTLRLDLRGTVFDHYDFRLMPDFAGGKLVVQDAYVDVRYCETCQAPVRQVQGAVRARAPAERDRRRRSPSAACRRSSRRTAISASRCSASSPTARSRISSASSTASPMVAASRWRCHRRQRRRGARVRAAVRDRPTSSRTSAFGGAATFGDKAANLAQPDTPVWKTAGQTTIFQYKAGTTLADTVVADGRHWRATAQGYYYAGPIGVLAEYVRSTQHVVLNGTHDRRHRRFVAGARAVRAHRRRRDATTASRRATRSIRRSGTYGAFDVAARVGELRVSRRRRVRGGSPIRRSPRAARGPAGVGVDWFANRSFRAVLDVERTWFTLGAKPPATEKTLAAADRAAETVDDRRAIQLVF